MNVQQWISCISTTHGVVGRKLSSDTTRKLLKRLPLKGLADDEETQGMWKMGLVSAVPPEVEFEDDIAEIEETMRRYFFHRTTYGEVFGPIGRVEQRFSRGTIEENYQLRSGPFLNLAKTYWTYKMEMHDLFPHHYDLVLMQLLARLEGDIASVFFPTPGPAVTEKEIDKAMESINSLEDLIDHFIKEDAQEPASPDPFGIGARTDEILLA